MNKTYTIIAAVAIGIVIIGSIIAFIRIRGGSGDEEIAPTPTPTPAYQEVDESVQAELEANAANTMVVLTVTGMDGRFESIEYEVTYMTDTGPKGTLSGSRPIPLTDPDEFSREIELGTCSTGGECTYHKGVKDFNVFLKFHANNGDVFVLKKEYDQV